MISQISIPRVASVALMACLSLSVGATTLIRMDLDALANSAEFVVRARCRATESRWESDSIWTFAEFEVLESFKGAPPRNLRVRLPGGRAGNMHTRVDGVPEFSVGEETVLFVERTSAGDLGITSWAQGTFRIRRDTAGGSRLTQDTSHFAVFDPQTRRFSPSGIRNMSLPEFRQKLGDVLSTLAPTPRHK
jgi:hypothetical protein